MLQKLRDQTQSTGFKILVGAIIVVLTLFGFGATNLFLGGDPEIAQVGDYSITQTALGLEIERERRRILAQMGPEFDESSIDPLQLSDYVTQQVINRQIAYQTARRLGVEIPPDTVNRELTSSEAYQVDGQFSEAVYRQYLSMMGYGPVEFLSEYTSALSSETVRAGVMETVAMTEWELGETVRVFNQTRDFAYLPLNVTTYLPDITVTDDEVLTRYEEESSAYLTELSVDVSFLALAVSDLVDDPSIKVEEEDIESLYEEEKTSSLRTEQRASSHILIQVNEERSDSAANALINQIASRLQSGEDFAELAAEFSEDPGSSAVGGQLDAVGQGIFDPAFEAALWALNEVGSLSQPVKTEFGYHIVRLDGIEAQAYPALESQREMLEEKVRRAQAEELFAEQVRLLEDYAYEEQSALIETAESAGLTLQTAKGVVESLPPEGVLGHPSVVSALFSTDVLNGNNSEGIVISEEEIVFVRVNEQYPPELKPLADVQDEIRRAIERERALIVIEEHKTQGLARLKADESVAEIAENLGSQWIQLDRVPRSPRTVEQAEIPPEVLAEAFSLPRPIAGARSVGVADYADGAALVTVTGVTQGDVDATSQAEVTQIRQVVEGRASRLEIQGFLDAAESELNVERPASAAGGT